MGMGKWYNSTEAAWGGALMSLAIGGAFPYLKPIIGVPIFSAVFVLGLFMVIHAYWKRDRVMTDIKNSRNNQLIAGDLKTVIDGLLADIDKFSLKTDMRSPKMPNNKDTASTERWVSEKDQYKKKTDNIFVTKFRRRITHVGDQLRLLNYVTDKEYGGLDFWSEPEHPQKIFIQKILKDSRLRVMGSANVPTSNPLHSPLQISLRREYISILNSSAVLLNIVNVTHTAISDPSGKIIAAKSIPDDRGAYSPTEPLVPLQYPLAWHGGQVPKELRPGITYSLIIAKQQRDVAGTNIFFETAYEDNSRVPSEHMVSPIVLDIEIDSTSVSFVSQIIKVKLFWTQGFSPGPGFPAGMSLEAELVN